MGRLLELAKRVPLDLGQGAVAERTQGKRIALALVPPGEGRAALDVGARRGEQTRWLRARGYRVTAIDRAALFPGCQEVDANDDLPFADQSFALVWCSEVIEHLRDPRHALAELERVTCVGGTVLVTTPNSGAWFFRLLARLGLPPERLQRKDHLHFFEEADLRRLAPDAELYGYFPYALVKWTLRRGAGTLSPTFVLRIVRGRQPVSAR